MSRQRPGVPPSGGRHGERFRNRQREQRHQRRHAIAADVRPARLAAVTPEKIYSKTASRDFHLFYVGRDDVHDILKHVLSRVRFSVYLNMFGFDDDDEARELVAEFGYTAHIRSRGEEAKALRRTLRTRARRWVVERTHSWMNRFRRVLIRWEKSVSSHLAMLHFACALITFGRTS